MKKSIATLLIIALLLGVMSIPAFAVDVKTGNLQNTRQIDNPKSGRLTALKALPTSYLAPTATTVKTLFAEKRAEIPSEMPIVGEAEIKGSKQIFVDGKNGNDSIATGTINKPYKTINAALKAHKPEAGMVLYLREGIYSISDSVELNNVKATEESPFIISNYNGEEVVVTGGTPVNGNDFGKVIDKDVIQRLNPDVIDDILVVNLKTKYGMMEG